MQEFRESLKILRQCAMLYKDTPPEILATHPEYVSASKEQILTQNYSLMQHFVLITQGLKPLKAKFMCLLKVQKVSLAFYP